MNALRVWGLKVGVLVVAMLATIGGWEVYKGTVKLTGVAQAQVEPVHYKCYDFFVEFQEPPVFGRIVETFNQFGREILIINEAKLLCLPTQKRELPPG